VISNRQKWCGCQKRKAQQSSTWAEAPEGAAKEEGRQREVRHWECCGYRHITQKSIGKLEK